MTVDAELLAVAMTARERAYAPYSRYAVGAALRGADGTVYGGCNVENAAYGAGICAERGALMALVAGGGGRWMACVVVTRDGGSPCGICRQMLAELADEGAQVWSVDETGVVTGRWTVEELLPDRFDGSGL